ncbi:MAG TPA: leucyl aminopeptidase [Mycobacteriales bacterium]|nr:leucyl aminopeptidase [Mycobacteriales bacterium]
MALSLTDKAADTLKVDAIVIGVAAGPNGLALPAGTGAVDSALGGRLGEALAAVGATGAEGEVTTIATLGGMQAPVVAAAGLGPVPADGHYPVDSVRQAAGAASRALFGRTTVASTLALVGGRSTPELVRAVAEGSLLGAYEFTAFKAPSEEHKAAPAAFQLVVSSAKEKDSQRAIKDAAAVVEAVTLARDLVNTPAGDLPPAELAARAQAAGRKAGIDVEILDEKALAKNGFGGVLGVGGGSSRPPRLVRLHYKPAHPKAKVALVGKGITFDSGGISIKPADSMHEMKGDMGGAAAVIATVCAAAALDLPLEVIATVPMAENLVSGTSYRPGDVLTQYGGKRVEVLNTDAEGRLVLADAIVRACEDEPAYLLETSTLTGAQRIALGTRTAGVMGSDELRDRVAEAGRGVGEPGWAMPLPKELRSGLDSLVADLANVAGNRYGGMLVAGHFLAEFVKDGVQWAHIDVAGPAYNVGDAWGYTPRGGTGAPVRTLLATLQDIADNG